MAMCDSHQPLNGADSDPQLGDCYSETDTPIHLGGWCDAHQDRWQAYQAGCNATMDLAEVRAVQQHLEAVN